MILSYDADIKAFSQEAIVAKSLLWNSNGPTTPGIPCMTSHWARTSWSEPPAGSLHHPMQLTTVPRCSSRITTHVPFACNNPGCTIITCSGFGTCIAFFTEWTIFRSPPTSVPQTIVCLPLIVAVTLVPLRRASRRAYWGPATSHTFFLVFLPPPSPRATSPHSILYNNVALYNI